jgi:hypothetical protein
MLPEKKKITMEGDFLFCLLFLNKYETLISLRIVKWIFFGGTGVWTQGCPQSICFNNFLNRVFIPRLTTVLLIFPLYMSEMTDVYHHTQFFIGWDGVLPTFLPDLALNHDPPDLHLPST